VIAHELSHIGNRDILLSTIVTVMVGMVVLLADWFWRVSFRRRGSSESKGDGQAIFMLIAVILVILAPIFATLMQLAISRKREFKAYADGALLTRYPEGLASALEKISADTEPLETANRATAHLYIVSPFKGDESGHIGFFTKLFLTHPPVEERVAALRGIKV
jgi:heat shock protein HtpX